MKARRRSSPGGHRSVGASFALALLLFALPGCARYPIPLQQALYDKGARPQSSNNQQAWKAMHIRFAPRAQCRDRSFEAALEADRAP